MKMRLKLVNFRCWENISFDLGNEITKIDGISGSGKSTIFEAIFYCLYGKLQRVKNKHNNGAISVTLETSYGQDTIQIVRTTQKNVTLHILDKEVCTGDTAQSMIDDYFGSYELFTMASYLRAETAHPLICASISEKRELTSLLFPDASKYNRYKEKVLMIRRSDEQAYQMHNKKVITAQSAIDNMHELHPWLRDKDMDIPTIDERVLLMTLDGKNKAKNDAIGIISTYNSLSQQLASIPEIKDITPLREDLADLQGQLNQCTVDALTKDTKIQFLQEKLTNISSRVGTLLGSLGHSSLDVQECTRIISICDELLSVAPSESDLNKRIKDTNTEYDEKSNLLTAYVRSLDNIQYNHRLDNVLECPSCHQKLQYMDTLSAYTECTERKPVEYVISQVDVQKLHAQVYRLEELKSTLRSRYNKYQDLLTKEDTRNKGISLRTLDLRVYREKLTEYLTLFKEKMLLEADIQAVQSDQRTYITKDQEKDLRERVATLSNMVATSLANQKHKDILSKKIQVLESQYEWLATHDTYLSSLISDIELMTQQLSKIKIQGIYQRNSSILSSSLEKVATLEGRIQASHQLDSLLASSYNIYVGQKLKEIEYDICILGKLFFDDTMNISLSPGKESSTGIVKPSFDITLEYRGIQYDDIKLMSTGERKRLSIILMIVLTKFTDGRILLLDEALNSVSLDTRGIIMNELSRLSIPIYITSHDEIPGGYTNELDLNAIH